MYLIKILKYYWAFGLRFLLKNRVELVVIPFENLNIPKPNYGLKRPVSILYYPIQKNL